MSYRNSLSDILLKFFTMLLPCVTVWCVLLSFIVGSALAAESDPPRLDAHQMNEQPRVHVVSINLCADQLILALADPEQILSLTNLSHDSAASFYVNQARDYPTNKGLAEEALALQPDLVIAGIYDSRYTLRQLDASGLMVKQLPIANSMAAVLENIQQVAIWLGQPQRGSAMVKQLQARLDDIVVPSEISRRAAVYDPNGYTVGRDSLRGDVLHRAGWVNVAAEKSITSYGVLPLETLVRLKPDMLLESPYSPGTYSRAQLLNEHPVLSSARMSVNIVNVPSAQTICGGPWTVDLIEQLSALETTIKNENINE